jgi:hypothetical protein
MAEIPRERGEMQRIPSANGDAASAGAATTEHDGNFVDECSRYE